MWEWRSENNKQMLKDAIYRALTFIFEHQIDYELNSILEEMSSKVASLEEVNDDTYNILKAMFERSLGIMRVD